MKAIKRTEWDQTMAHRRSLSWSAAIRDLRQDRSSCDLVERRMCYRQQAFAKIAGRRARVSNGISPLVTDGAFHRSAIMSAAIEAARARRMVTGEPWNICLSAALRGTWQAAKEARAFAAHQARRDAERAQRASLRPTPDHVTSTPGEGRPGPGHHPEPPGKCINRYPGPSEASRYPIPRASLRIAAPELCVAFSLGPLPPVG